MIKKLSFAEQCMVRVLCAFALLLVGFAHKPPVIEGSPIPISEIAQYILPDGTLPVLCLPSEDGKTKHDHHHDAASICEACRLTASFMLPAPAGAFDGPVIREIETLTALWQEAFYRQLFPPNTAPRGPPSQLTA